MTSKPRNDLHQKQGHKKKTLTLSKTMRPNKKSKSKVESSVEPVKPRHVYFDLGANWANTLRLYKDIADPDKVDVHPWEVYAFETSPLIVPYLDEFVNSLNGEGKKPRLLWPPTGSLKHLSMYADRYGCNPDSGLMKKCMIEKFEGPLTMMKPNTTLMTEDVIDSRMAIARSPPSDNKDRFVLIPGGAGAANFSLHIDDVDPEHMLWRDRVVYTRRDELRHGIQYDVPVADFVSMLINNFRKEDYVVVKMDIEGHEFPILNRMMAQKNVTRGLIDVLALECHSFAGRCVQLNDRAQKLAGKVLYEDKDYEPFDSLSTPERYVPKNPDIFESLYPESDWVKKNRKDISSQNQDLPTVSKEVN